MNSNANRQSVSIMPGKALRSIGSGRSDSHGRSISIPVLALALILSGLIPHISSAATFVDSGSYLAVGFGDSAGGGYPADYGPIEGTRLPDGSRTAGLAVSLPTPTSIQFDGYLDNWIYGSVGNSRTGVFQLDSPTVVTLSGLVDLRAQTNRVLTFDFRVDGPGYLFKIYSTPGTRLISDNILLPAGTYSFNLGATGADIGNSVDFSLLLTIPEPSTASLLGLGLAGIAMTRRKD
ncbi:PEP-CTERM sorting domain-containing protein [Myxococcota bacterium]|nr:PEP-CTERM sorting domain-containing protein [Myxococcota bacterium]